MIYLQLFLSFLQIGAFSFGGGYAALPLIQNQVVEIHGWLSLGEFTDLITISQMTPGPIAINSATFVGTKIAGIFGALAATLGCILPSCLIVSTIAYFYFKYKNLTVIQSVLHSLRPAVVAMIASAGLAIIISAFFGTEGVVAIENLNLSSVVIFGIAVILLRWKNLNPVTVMILSGVMEVIFTTTLKFMQ
ncbi:MAG: chromate transporter [Clostridium sp.]